MGTIVSCVDICNEIASHLPRVIDLAFTDKAITARVLAHEDAARWREYHRVGSPPHYFPARGTVKMLQNCSLPTVQMYSAALGGHNYPVIDFLYPTIGLVSLMSCDFILTGDPAILQHYIDRGYVISSRLASSIIFEERLESLGVLVRAGYFDPRHMEASRARALRAAIRHGRADLVARLPCPRDPELLALACTSGNVDIIRLVLANVSPANIRPEQEFACVYAVVKTADIALLRQFRSAFYRHVRELFMRACVLQHVDVITATVSHADDDARASAYWAAIGSENTITIEHLNRLRAVENGIAEQMALKVVSLDMPKLRHYINIILPLDYIPDRPQ